MFEPLHFYNKLFFNLICGSNEADKWEKTKVRMLSSSPMCLSHSEAEWEMITHSQSLKQILDRQR